MQIQGKNLYVLGAQANQIQKINTEKCKIIDNISISEDGFKTNFNRIPETDLAVITDIKKNTKGETWVKYKNLSNWEENTEEIYTFAERRNKIC
jgi:hypothetical protein